MIRATNKPLRALTALLLAAPALGGCAVFTVVGVVGTAASLGVGAATTVGSVAVSGVSGAASLGASAVRAVAPGESTPANDKTPPADNEPASRAPAETGR